MFQFRTVVASLAIIASLTVICESTSQAQLMGRFRGQSGFANRITPAPRFVAPRSGNFFSGNLFSNRFGAQSYDGTLFDTVEPTLAPRIPTPAGTIQRQPIVVPANTGAMMMPGCGCGTAQAVIVQPYANMNGSYITVPATPKMAAPVEKAEVTPGNVDPPAANPKSVLASPPAKTGNK